MRAIVTGGAGFIGSNLADVLLGRGDEVHVLDDLSKGSRENVAADSQLHVADIREPDEVIDGVEPEVVFISPPRRTSACRSRSQRWTRT
jgi:UDP-glucose 4-epimerase